MPSTGRVVLVRHGECVYDACGREAGLINSELTDAGRAQARSCATTLTAYDLRDPMVLTSPLERALSTARVLARALSAPLHVRWELIERHLGGWTAQRRRDLGQEPSGPEARPPVLAPTDPVSAQIVDGLHQYLSRTGRDGETRADVTARVGAVWAAAVGHALAGRDVVLVSHGWPLRSILRELGEPHDTVELAPADPITIHPAVANVAARTEGTNP